MTPARVWRCRVVIAEGPCSFSERASDGCSVNAEVDVAATCGDVESLAAVEAERPDVVVTDIRMPPFGGDEGIQAAAHIGETYPETRRSTFSADYAEPGYALALFESSTARRAYLLKERVEDINQLVAAILTVADGGSVIDPKVVEALVAAKDRANK